MIRPYIDMSYEDDLDIVGIVFTCGYLTNEKCFQMALTIFNLTIAIGVVKEEEDDN